MKEQFGVESLTGLVAFARVVSQGSYTAAARSLGVSPSAVSKSVQRLEDQLQLKLLSRTTRAMAATPEGREVYERALRLIDEVEGIGQVAAATRGEPAGVLKVAAAAPIGVHLIAPLLPVLRARHPALTVDLRLGDQYVDLIEGGFDLAIRVGPQPDSRLVARALGPNRLCGFASPDYLARRGVPQHPDDLAGHDLANYRYQSSGQALRWGFGGAGPGAGDAPVAAQIVVDLSDALAAVLAAGGGIGVLATYIAAPWVARGQLVPVLRPYAWDSAQITACWPESRRGNRKVQAFVALLGEMFPSPLPWDAMVDRCAAGSPAAAPVGG